MAAKTILVVSSLLALTFAAQPAFATDVANASPQQISPPTELSADDQPSAQPAQPAQPPKRHHRKHARKHRRQQQQQPQQPPADPQGGGSAPNPG
jgi:hypothetical protein